MFNLFTAKLNLFPHAFVWAYIFIWEKCWEFIFWTSIKTMIQLNLNLMRSIRVPRKHKYLKPRADKKSKMFATAAILKINYQHLFLNLWLIWDETCSVETGQLLDRNGWKSCWSEIQDGHHSRHLENLFWASRKLQGELSWTYNVATG